MKVPISPQNILGLASARPNGWLSSMRISDCVAVASVLRKLSIGCISDISKITVIQRFAGVGLSVMRQWAHRETA